MVFPIAKGLTLSFQQWSIHGSGWVGWSNYAQVLTDGVFWKSLRITAIYTVLTVALGIALSLVVAFMIEPLSARWQTFFKSAFYLPSVAPIVIVSILWSWIFHPAFGLLNYAIGRLGMAPVLWLADPGIALYSIVLMALTVGQGHVILILSAALGGIPKDYHESARIDGAGVWREIVSVKLPLLKPALLYLLVVNTIASFQVFAPIYLLTAGGPNGATRTIGFLIYESGFKKFQFGVASAQAVILLLLVMIVAVVQFRSMASDVEY